MFIYDLHCHTKEVSMCGQVPAKEVVRRYKKIGFDAIVITDHFFREFFEGFELESEFATHRYPEVDEKFKKWWETEIDKYLEGYRKAKEEGDKIGLKVLLAMEIRFPECANDYLVYGIDEEFLKNSPRLYNVGIANLRKHIKALGYDALVFQAHPFRNGMVRANVEYLDGAETYNGHFNHENRNDKAKEWAVANNLLECSGTDFHDEDAEGKAGIKLPLLTDDWKVILGYLKNREFEFLTTSSSEKI